MLIIRYNTVDSSCILATRFYNLFSYSTELSMKLILLANVKMPTIVGILTFTSRINKPSLSVLKQEISLFFSILVYEKINFYVFCGG